MRVAPVDESSVSVSVRDEGPGIPARMQERIFERFERAGHDDKITGLGLGLYITRQIARAHGGDIEVRSAPGKGCEFILTLPRFGPPAP
jgi:signal transduction histidine kinase